MIRPKHSREILRFGSHNIFRSYLGRGGIFDCVSAYPRIHFTIYLEVYLGRGGTFDCVSAYPRIHFTIYLQVYLGRGGTFDCVSAYPRIHFTIYLEVYLGRGGIFDCVSAYPLHNILKSLLGEEWYFRLRIRVSSLFRGAASKWQGILQLLHLKSTVLIFGEFPSRSSIDVFFLAAFLFLCPGNII